ncbi:hypothetical protein ACHAWO_001941 [Cyclotella atomus]|uniref:DDE Tnp4 domain-containing protein n=1 Tax=Cyclotella atomus TaxID=382360 RepID=A0ABD3NI86_9STRA
MRLSKWEMGLGTHYSFPPETVAAVLYDNSNVNPKTVFITLYWWKRYDKEFAMESRWHWHPDTIRSKLFKCCGQLAERKADKIVFDHFEEGQSQTFLAGIDCVHFEWQEGRTDPGSRWYSHKSNGPGLSYEVCVDAVKDRIVWTNGPFPAATHDITIFRGGTKKNGPATWHKSSLFHKMIVEKRLVDDSGYAGEPDKVSITLAGHLPQTKELFTRIKSRGESLFRAYKRLNIMGRVPFQHKGEQRGGSEELGSEFWRNSGRNSCSVPFSGIFGPGVAGLIF